MWVVGDRTLHGVDPDDGTVVTSLESVALDCVTRPDGVVAPEPDQLMIVCNGGDWYVISSVDGDVLDQGNNSIDMFGSAYFSFAQCGDAVVEGEEDCDEGASAGCDVDCTFVQCGDGTTNPLADEECDDGNVQDGDGCSAACRVELPSTSDETGESTSTSVDITGGTSEGTGTSSDDGGESTSDASAAAGSDAGCGCQHTAPRGWLWSSLAIIGLRRGRPRPRTSSRRWPCGPTTS